MEVHRGLDLPSTMSGRLIVKGLRLMCLHLNGRSHCIIRGTQLLVFLLSARATAQRPCGPSLLPGVRSHSGGVEDDVSWGYRLEGLIVQPFLGLIVDLLTHGDHSSLELRVNRPWHLGHLERLHEVEEYNVRFPEAHALLGLWKLLLLLSLPAG